MDFVDHHDSDASTKRSEYLIKSSSTSLIFLAETLIKEVKPVGMETHELEYRDQCVLMAHFGIFGLSGF